MYKHWFLSSAYVVSPGPTCRNSVFLFFCHSVSNFLGIQLANTLVSGSGSNKPVIRDIGPSNSRALLSHATLRFFSLAEQCHTQKFYLRCFKSDFDALKNKFGLLLIIRLVRLVCLVCLVRLPTRCFEQNFLISSSPHYN